MVTDAKVAHKFLSLRRSAKDREIDFDLSLASIKNLLNAKKCYYTGVLLNEVEGDPNQRTIDRVDNNKGYVKGNVVACCFLINQKKGNLTINEIKAIAKKVNKLEK